MSVYDRVAKSIVPKKAALAEAEAKLGGVMAELNVKQDEVAAINAKVAKLQSDYKASMDKKKSLEDQAQQTKDRLVRAEKLIGGLGDEKVRWQSTSKMLSEAVVNLTGDVLLSAGCIAYLGP